MYYLPLILAFITLGILLIGSMNQFARPFKISMIHSDEIKKLSIILLHLLLIVATTSIESSENQSGKIIATIIGLYSLIWVFKK